MGVPHNKGSGILGGRVGFGLCMETSVSLPMSYV